MSAKFPHLLSSSSCDHHDTPQYHPAQAPRANPRVIFDFHQPSCFPFFAPRLELEVIQSISKIIPRIFLHDQQYHTLSLHDIIAHQNSHLFPAWESVLLHAKNNNDLDYKSHFVENQPIQHLETAINAISTSSLNQFSISDVNLAQTKLYKLLRITIETALEHFYDDYSSHFCIRVSLLHHNPYNDLTSTLRSAIGDQIVAKTPFLIYIWCDVSDSQHSTAYSYEIVSITMQQWLELGLKNKNAENNGLTQCKCCSPRDTIIQTPCIPCNFLSPFHFTRKLSDPMSALGQNQLVLHFDN